MGKSDVKEVTQKNGFALAKGHGADTIRDKDRILEA